MNRLRRNLWWIAGLAIAAPGVVLVWTSTVTSDYGWVAYTSLETRSDWRMGWLDGNAVLVTRRAVVGFFLTLTGLLLLAGGLGYRWGRRRTRSA